MSPQEAVSWLATATNLKQKYADFQKMRGDLSASKIDAKKYPALAKERATLLKRASDTDAKISGTVKAVESAYAEVKNIAYQVGSTLLSPFEFVAEKIGLNGLGILPVLIPVAVIAAALAGITFWTKDSVLFFQKVNEQKRLEASGMAPEQASAIIEKKASVGFFDKLGSTLGLVIIGGAVWFGYQQYTKGKKNG